MLCLVIPRTPWSSGRVHRRRCRPELSCQARKRWSAPGKQENHTLYHTSHKILMGQNQITVMPSPSLMNVLCGARAGDCCNGTGVISPCAVPLFPGSSRKLRCCFCACIMRSDGDMKRTKGKQTSLRRSCRSPTRRGSRDKTDMSAVSCHASSETIIVAVGVYSRHMLGRQAVFPAMTLPANELLKSKAYYRMHMTNIP